MPSNSDITFILSQYIACAEKLRADNIYLRHDDWYWDIEGVARENQEGQINTPPPKKLAHTSKHLTMPRDRDSSDLTTAEKTEKHDNLMPLLNSMFREFQELSKKKPDGALNKRKVEIVTGCCATSMESSKRVRRGIS